MLEAFANCILFKSLVLELFCMNKILFLNDLFFVIQHILVERRQYTKNI